MNLTSIITGIQRFGFDSTDPTTDWANAAYSEFIDAADWIFLKKSATGTFTISTATVTPLPTDLGVPTALMYGDGTNQYPIDFKAPLEFQQDGWLTPSETGSPRWWTYYGGSVFVYPLVDFAYTWTLYYESAPALLSNGPDVPAIPARYHYAIVQGGAAIGLEVDNQEERAATQRQNFQAAIDRAVAKYASAQAGSFSKVRSVYY